MNTTIKSAIVLFAHGSRDRAWALPFRKIQRRLKSKLEPTQTAVELAFLEIMAPSLAEAVTKLADGGHKRIMVAPLFMAQGAHLQRDLSGIIAAIRTAHRSIEIEVLPAIGEVDTLLTAICDWLVVATTR